MDNNHFHLTPRCSPCEDDCLEIFTAEFSDCSIKCCIPQQTLATTSLGSSAAILQFKTYYWWPGAPGLGWLGWAGRAGHIIIILTSRTKSVLMFKLMEHRIVRLISLRRCRVSVSVRASNKGLRRFLNHGEAPTTALTLRHY